MHILGDVHISDEILAVIRVIRSFLDRNHVVVSWIVFGSAHELAYEILKHPTKESYNSQTSVILRYSNAALLLNETAASLLSGLPSCC